MANPDYITRLKKAIRDLHGCDSEHVETVSVHEQFRGQTAWRGEVEVFKMQGHPRAARCYAWSSRLESGGTKEQFFAVLQSPPIATAADAVRASISSGTRFKPQAGKIYKAVAFALERDKNILMEADLIFEQEGARAYLVLEWWPNTGKGDVPKNTVEIDPAYLQKVSGQQFDFFYRGQISIPQSCTRQVGQSSRLSMNHPTRESIFRDAAKTMRAAFEDARNNVPHRGEAGGEGEEIVRRFLSQHLPKRFAVTNGFVIDREDKISGHTDVIVYDAHNCPVYRTSERGMILPNDNVASVIEVKFQLTTTTLDVGIAKMHELRNLAKTPFPPSPDDMPLGLKGTYGVIFAFESSLKPETVMERWRSKLTDRNPLHQSLSLIVVLDKGVFTTFVRLPGRGPAPAVIHGVSQHAPGTSVGVMYYDTGDMALDVFLRLLLAHLTFFRHRVDHPGFGFTGSDRVMAVEFGQYVSPSEIRYSQRA
ncbi:MAG: DUF6602 domain-containing protein [Verrucomicrobiota bacterium]